MAKHNKIIVCISTDDTERRRMIQRLAIKHGFAQTPGDANKIIRTSPTDFDLNDAYFVLATTYNLNASPMTTNQLYRLAAMGVAVIVGLKKIQPQYEFMCEIYNQGEV